MIVGGGSGMGAAAARKLAASGYAVSVMSSSGKGEALGKELGGIGLTGSNLSNDDLKRFVQLTLEKFGRIDVLVNSAGHGPKGPLLEISDEDWHKGFDVYFMNVARAARLVAPHMIAQKSGSIVNISTAWVDEPSDMFPTSAVARSGLTAYKALRRPICGAKCAHQQCPARLDRQPAGKGRAPRRRAHAALWFSRRDRRSSSLPRLGKILLHHRPEHPRRWWVDAVGLMSPFSR